MNYFSDADFTAALGIGKLVTSVTMTIFYNFRQSTTSIGAAAPHGRG